MGWKRRGEKRRGKRGWPEFGAGIGMLEKGNKDRRAQNRKASY